LHRAVAAALVLAVAPGEQGQAGTACHAVAQLACLGTELDGLTLAGRTGGEGIRVHDDSFWWDVAVWCPTTVAVGRAIRDGAVVREACAGRISASARGGGCVGARRRRGARPVRGG